MKKPLNPFKRPRQYEDEDWPEAPYWPFFIEKLFLSIIDAYPNTKAETVHQKDADRQKRLNAAIKALTNIKRANRGSKKKYDLEYQMRIANAKDMLEGENAVEEMRGRQPLNKNIPGVRTSWGKKKEIDKFSTDKSVEDRQRRLRRDSKMQRYTNQIAVLNYHAEEEDFMRSLLLITSELQKYNISMKVDPEALGMASLWGDKSG